MDVTSVITKGYENKPPIRAPKKQSQIPKRQKPMQTSLPQRIMKITAILGPGKTKPIKPKQTQSPRPCYSKPTRTPGEDTLQKPVCIFKTYCYIDDQWNSASPPDFNGWISIFSFHSGGLLNLLIHDRIITGEPSWEHCGC
jgi:hypothetical protein